MDEKRREWRRQQSANFGAREFVRFGCAFIGWTFLGVAIGVALEVHDYPGGQLVTGIFLLTAVMFPLVSLKWKPPYTILRRILGNENLPTEPMPRLSVRPRAEPRPRWFYLWVAWRWLINLLLLYAVIRYFSK